MALTHFFESNARSKARCAIVAVESQTSDELLVAVRRQAGPYVHIGITVAGALGYLLLLIQMISPRLIRVQIVPVEFAAVVIVGYLLCWLSWTQIRRFTRDTTMETATWQADCATFRDKRISRTSGCLGILNSCLKL